MTQATQSASPVLLEKKHGAIVTLTLNRPDRLNALNNDLSMALNEALTRIGGDLSTHVVILTGAGRAFCAGGDLGDIGKGRESGDAEELGPLLRAGMQSVLKLRTIAQPVITAVNGPAAGAGMNLALACDIRIAVDGAIFGQNFAKVGLFPDYGGTFFLPELVGPSVAAEMFYTGDMIDTATAHRLGIANYVVPAAQLEAEVKALAQKIAQGPPIALRAVKKILFGSHKDALVKALDHEVELQMKCFHSEDCSEGIRAFFEKRHPKFQGK